MQLKNILAFLFLSIFTTSSFAQEYVDPRLPDPRMQVMLIKNTLIALNHANVTGNYTVLRDLCSPGMRQEMKSADFAITFKNSSDRSRDLSFVMEMKPIQTVKPVLAANNTMQLIGYFPSAPLLLHYKLIFLKTEQGDWWIDGLVIDSSPNQQIANVPQTQPQQTIPTPSQPEVTTLLEQPQPVVQVARQPKRDVITPKATTPPTTQTETSSTQLLNGYEFRFKVSE